MTKLTKADLKERDAVATRLAIAFEALGEVADLEEGAVRDDVAVRTAIEAYNNEIYDANQYREDIASRIQEYIDNKSENWQEGDKGQAFVSWQEQWDQEFDGVTVELEYFDWSDVADVQETLEQLPEAPDV